jgi:Tol biopolymer transport system component
MPTPTKVSASSTPSSVPTSPTAVELLEQQLLLQLEGEDVGQIWITSYPFQDGKVLFQDNDYFYGRPIWSHDGTQIAFSRTSVGCPTTSSSIWVSSEDGTDARQVSESVQGRINPNTGDCSLTLVHPASPRAWSFDGKLLAVDIYGPRILDVETGQSNQVYPKSVLATAGLDGVCQ